MIICNDNLERKGLSNNQSYEWRHPSTQANIIIYDSLNETFSITDKHIQPFITFLAIYSSMSHDLRIRSAHENRSRCRAPAVRRCAGPVVWPDCLRPWEMALVPIRDGSCVPPALRYKPRYARRKAGFWVRSAAWPDRAMVPCSMM